MWLKLSDIPDDELLKALESNHGFINYTAKALGVPTKTLTKHIYERPAVLEGLAQINEIVLDKVECRLIEIANSNHVNAVNACKLILEAKRKSVGYGVNTVNVELNNKGEDLARRLADFERKINLLETDVNVIAVDPEIITEASSNDQDPS